MKSRVLVLFFCLMLSLFVLIVALQEVFPAVGPQSVEQNLVILSDTSVQPVGAIADKNSFKSRAA